MDLFHKTASVHPLANPLKTKPFFAILNASLGEDIMNSLQKAGLYAFSALTMLAQGCGKNSDPTPAGPVEPIKTVNATVVFNADEKSVIETFVGFDTGYKFDFDLKLKTSEGNITTALNLPEPYTLKVMTDNIKIAPQSPANAVSPNLASIDPNKPILVVVADDGSFGTIETPDPETKKMVRQNVAAITVKTNTTTGVSTVGLKKPLEITGDLKNLLQNVSQSTGKILPTRAMVENLSTAATYLPY